MKCRYLLTVIVAVSLVLGNSVDAMPPGLKVQPLEYRETIKKAETKKGYIDISNPSMETIKVATDVQAFRQINDNGDLEFYDSEQLSAGVKLDLDEFELGPLQAMRMYFLVDGAKLPSGDVFGAIFFTQQVKSGAGVRVGTLLSLVNGTPSGRSAEITRVSASFMQFGDITTQYSIKNTGDPKKTTGFFPVVNVSTAPFGQQQTHTSSLLFAGRERQNDATISPSFGGFYRVRVAYESSHKDAYVLSITPVFVSVIVLGTAAGAATLVWWRRRQARRPKRSYGRKR